jgi:DNA-binding PadR family transcriptional regulator
MNKPYTKSLNTDQYKFLIAIYSCRFSTRSTLAEYLGIPNNTSLYSRLQILQKHGYIASHYGKEYKLAGREAEFYTLPKGLRALHDAKLLDTSGAMMAAIYKDKSVSKGFIAQQVLLLTIRNKLMSTYDNLQIFTARDIQALEYFPKPRPDLFLSMKHSDGTVTRFFLEYIPAGTLSSKLQKRLGYLTRYYEENSWDETGTPLPSILFVAETGLMESSLRRLIAREQYQSDTDIAYYTTTQKALHNTTSADGAIWTDASDPDDLLALTDIDQ